MVEIGELQRLVVCQKLVVFLFFVTVMRFVVVETMIICVLLVGRAWARFGKVSEALSRRINLCGSVHVGIWITCSRSSRVGGISFVGFFF